MADMEMSEQEIRTRFRGIYENLENNLKTGSKGEILNLACEAAAFAVGGRDIGLDMTDEEFDLVELLARYHGQQ